MRSRITRLTLSTERSAEEIEAERKLLEAFLEYTETQRRKGARRFRDEVAHILSRAALEGLISPQMRDFLMGAIDAVEIERLIKVHRKT